MKRTGKGHVEETRIENGTKHNTEESYLATSKDNILWRPNEYNGHIWSKQKAVRNHREGISNGPCPEVQEYRKKELSEYIVPMNTLLDYSTCHNMMSVAGGHRGAGTSEKTTRFVFNESR